MAIGLNMSGLKPSNYLAKESSFSTIFFSLLFIFNSLNEFISNNHKFFLFLLLYKYFSLTLFFFFCPFQKYFTKYENESVILKKEKKFGFFNWFLVSLNSLIWLEFNTFALRNENGRWQ